MCSVLVISTDDHIGSNDGIWSSMSSLSRVWVVIVIGGRRVAALCVLQVKEWVERQASWVTEKAELEQRAEDGEEKAQKLDKYT